MQVTLVGATFSLLGSLMQQITQNKLISPLTLGSFSGAWLNLVVINIWFSSEISLYQTLAAMVGALRVFC
ncbi:TPA: iron chelate uptake ABC transporter family permease subunit [Providencia alcalifaciens]